MKRYRDPVLRFNFPYQTNAKLLNFKLLSHINIRLDLAILILYLFKNYNCVTKHISY